MTQNSILQKIQITKNNIDRMDYSKLLRSKERYWNKIDAEYVLIFQTDSCICRFGIENFLKYDYIGAPYGGNPFQNKNLNIKIGNGKEEPSLTNTQEISENDKSHFFRPEILECSEYSEVDFLTCFENEMEGEKVLKR